MKKMEDVVCKNCGIAFQVPESEMNHKRRKGQKNVYCGRKCARDYLHNTKNNDFNKFQRGH